MLKWQNLIGWDEEMAMLWEKRVKVKKSFPDLLFFFFSLSFLLTSRTFYKFSSRSIALTAAKKATGNIKRSHFFCFWIKSGCEMRKTGGTEKKRVRRQSTAVQNAAIDPNSDTPPRVCLLFPSRFDFVFWSGVLLPSRGYDGFSMILCLIVWRPKWHIHARPECISLMCLLDMLYEFFFWVLIYVYILIFREMVDRREVRINLQFLIWSFSMRNGLRVAGWMIKWAFIVLVSCQRKRRWLITVHALIKGFCSAQFCSFVV